MACGGGGGGGRVGSEVGWFTDTSIAAREWTDILNTAFKTQANAAIGASAFFTGVRITNYGTGDIWFRFADSSTSIGGNPATVGAERLLAGESVEIDMGVWFGVDGPTHLAIYPDTFGSRVAIRAEFYIP